MRKWKIIVFFLIVPVLPMYSLADNIIGNTGNSNIQIKTSFTIPDQGKLEYINLGFCDEELKNIRKQNNFSIRPGQTKEICMIFFNSSSGDSINISSSFVDAEKDTNGKFVCSIGTSTGISLVSLLTYVPKEYNFTLAPQEKVIKKAKITIPKNMTGKLQGCIGYQLDQKKPDNYTGLFFIVRRKVGFMEVNITGDVYNLGLRDDLKYTYKDNQIVILKIVAGILVVLFIYYISMATKQKQAKTNKRK